MDSRLLLTWGKDKGNNGIRVVVVVVAVVAVAVAGETKKKVISH